MTVSYAKYSEINTGETTLTFNQLDTNVEVITISKGLVVLKSLEQKNIDDSFMDDAKVEVTNKLPINGTVFNGYLVSKNDFMGSVYTFYKTDALPSRLSKGLVEEYNEFKEKQSQIQYTKSQITTIEEQDPDDDFHINFGDYLEIEPAKDDEKNVQNDEELAAFMDPDKMFGAK